ncbi:MOSC domain-containing protein [uncultured Metabacillus sp.]|uniref:MOSC domain-containing protein n=1 Tax=uncultured Metabacillus sp. TaxID=2860135 RepID=UPI00261D9FEE|nr:MOSC domain-containing protein [uncultured Metabacillus sp.]
MTTEIIWLSKGKPKTLLHKGREYRSGISKDQVESFEVTFERVSGDDVENHEFHGGADRVVCLYPYEHYAFWESTYQTTLRKAAFGENLTAKGMIETNVCVGDVYKIGDAVLQVAQGRFPCATINKHTNINTILNKMIELGYTGFFFRVLKEGTITAKSDIKLLEKHPKQVSIASIHHTYFHQQDLSKIETILSVDELSLEWKKRLIKLYNQLLSK